MMNPLRIAVYTLLLLICAIMAEGWFNGPNPWILQYDFQGIPSSAMARNLFIIGAAFFLLVSNGVIAIVLRTVASDPTLKSVGIPHQEYWRKPENTKEGLTRLHRLLHGVLIFLNTILLITLLMTRFVVSGTAVNVVVIGAFVFSIFFIFWTFRLFRPA